MKWIVGILGSLASCLLAWLAIYLFGNVGGIEFSPSEFRYRSFQYFEIPGVHIQIRPIVRGDLAHPLADCLRTKGFLPAGTARNSRWDLVWIERQATVGQGDANMLYRLLAREEPSRGSYWLKWTQTNDLLARRLWPEIQRLAEMELYFLIPALMDVVETETEEAAFQLALDDHLARVLEFHATTQHELGKNNSAVELFDEALRHLQPGSVRAESVRSRRQELLPAAGPQAESGG